MSFKRLRRQVLYCLFRVAAFPLELLPLGSARRVGIGLGLLVWLVAGSLRRQSVQRLEASFVTGGVRDRDPAWCRRTARGMFRNLGRVLGESFYFTRRDPGRVEALIDTVEGMHHLEELARQGRGGVVITPHLGNFELLAAYLYRRFDGVVVEKRAQGSAFTDFMSRRRVHLGMKVVKQEASPRPLLRVLKEGRFVGILPDQDMDQLPGIFIPFFGRDAYTATAPASLARLARVPLITAYIVWNGSGYDVRIDPPHEVDRSDSKEDDVERATRAWSRAFEERISRYPEQWVWLHPRWKTTPDRLREKRRRREERRARDRSGETAARNPVVEPRS